MQQDSKCNLFDTYNVIWDFSTCTNICCHSTFDLNWIFEHHICICALFNVFYSCIPVIMLNRLRFKSSVLFGTYTLLDKLLTLLWVSFLGAGLRWEGGGGKITPPSYLKLVRIMLETWYISTHTKVVSENILVPRPSLICWCNHYFAKKSAFVA